VFKFTLFTPNFHLLKTPWKRRFSYSFSIEFDSRVPKFIVNEEDYPCGFSDIDFMCDEDNYCEFSDGRNFTG
jgi:hypothetical protein